MVAEHGTQRLSSSCPRVLFVPLCAQEDPVHDSCPPHLEGSPFTSTYSVFVADIGVFQNVLWLKKCGLAHAQDLILYLDLRVGYPLLCTELCLPKTTTLLIQIGGLAD